MDKYQRTHDVDTPTGTFLAGGQSTSTAADTHLELTDSRTTIPAGSRCRGRRSTNPDRQISGQSVSKTRHSNKPKDRAKLEKAKQDTERLSRRHKHDSNGSAREAQNTSFTESLIVHRGSHSPENGGVGRIRADVDSDLLDDICLSTRHKKTSQWLYKDRDAPWDPWTVRHSRYPAAEDIEVVQALMDVLNGADNQ